jgi:hypothetical protein
LGSLPDEIEGMRRDGQVRDLIDRAGMQGGADAESSHTFQAWVASRIRVVWKKKVPACVDGIEVVV